MRHGRGLLIVMLVHGVLPSTAQDTGGQWVIKGGGESPDLERRVEVNPYLNWRVGVHKDRRFIRRQSGYIRHSGLLSGSALSTLIDVHPVAGDFRLTVGAFIQSRDMDFLSEPTVNRYFPGATIPVDKDRVPQGVDVPAADIDLNRYGIDRQFKIESTRFEFNRDALPERIRLEPERIRLDRHHANVRGNIGFQTVAPYVGFGWGSNRFGNRMRWGYSIDIGVLYLQSRRIDGELGGDITRIHPLLTDFLDKELAAGLKDKVSDSVLFPYASAGVQVLW